MPDPHEEAANNDSPAELRIGRSVPSDSSVLLALESRGGPKLGVLLPDVDDPGPPVLKLRGTESAGRYEVLGEIAHGGVGVILRGRDRDLGRDVAIKLLRENHLKDASMLERFVEEAQIGGQLQHPGIAPVYELGLNGDRRPYLAMKLIRGESFASVLSHLEDPHGERRRMIAIFEQICQTMAYAHARQVIHRDLKPSNVMVGSFGEVQVVDWGFAKVLSTGGVSDEATPVAPKEQETIIATTRSDPKTGSHSVAGSVFGTPAYMPPEQAHGFVDQMDQRSDVFALGAILCEILTGSPPYVPDDGDLLIQAANAEMYFAFRSLDDCRADPMLVDLAKACLSPAQRQRPASAKQVASRVTEYLSSVEDRARRAEVQAAEARVRSRATVRLSAVILLAAGLIGGGIYWFEAEEAQRREVAEVLVVKAMGDARALEANAQASDRIDTWANALAAAEKAEALARSSDITAAWREESINVVKAISTQWQRVKSADEQRKLEAWALHRLTEIQMPREVTLYHHDLQPDKLSASQSSDYAELFLELGIDVDRGTSQTATRLIEDSAVRERLVSGLDHWGFVLTSCSQSLGDANAARSARIRSLCRRLDPNPWRNELRELAVTPAHNKQRLLGLAQSDELLEQQPIGFLLLGHALTAAQSTEEARNVYRLGRQIHPDSLALNCYFARASYTEGYYQEAEHAYRAALALSPQSAKLWHKLSVSLMRQHRTSEAAAACERSIAIDSTNAELYSNLGQILWGGRRSEESAACFRHAIDLDPSCASAHSNLGMILAQQNDFDAAMKCHERAIASDPKDPSAYVAKGHTLFLTGRLETAIGSYRKALEIDPEFPFAHSGIGSVLGMQGKLEAARKSHQRAIDIDDSPFTNNQYGRTLLAHKEFEAALGCFRHAMELDPDALDPQVGLGRALIGSGEIDAAIAHLRSVVQRNPRLAIAHNCLALALERHGMIDAALDAFDRAIELDPTFDVAYINRGWLRFRRGESDAAIENFERAITLNPYSVEGHWNLGGVLQQLGRDEESIVPFSEAVRCQPENYELRITLSCALLLCRRFEEAISHLEHCIKLSPRRPEGLLNLGSALAGLGRYEESLASYRRALAALSPGTRDQESRWAEQASTQIAALETMVAEEDELVAIARGTRDGATDADWIDAADLMYRRKSYALSTNTYMRAFRARPSLQSHPDHRYNAACAAVLASGVRGADALSEPVRREFLQRAFEWLQLDLQHWKGEFDAGGTRGVESRRQLRHRQKDSDLDRIRTDDSLKLLPKADATRWRAYWQELADILKQPQTPR